MEPLYILTGKVIHGHNRGKQLGFPTINFGSDDKIKAIEEGLYLSQTKVDDNTFNSLTFIGPARTFHETDYLAETYILDFTGDAYDTEVTVSILQKLRGNMSFNTQEELIEQMKLDEGNARKFFLSFSHNTDV